MYSNLVLYNTSTMVDSGNIVAESFFWQVAACLIVSDVI